MEGALDAMRKELKLAVAEHIEELFSAREAAKKAGNHEPVKPWAYSSPPVQE